jgi:hypothetical protein
MNGTSGYERAAAEHLEWAMSKITAPPEPHPVYGTVTDFGPLTRSEVDAIVEEASAYQKRVDSGIPELSTKDREHFLGYLAGMSRVLRLVTGVERFHVISPITGWEGDVDWQAVFRMTYTIADREREING